MQRRSQTAVFAATWLAAVFRYRALFTNTFHADEALFATWARLIAVWRDPLLQTQLVDKPPLLFYLQALFYPLLGPVAWAARMPNFIASLLLVPLAALLAWRLYKNEQTAVFIAVFIALFPFTIQFSATAFTDPLLATLLVAALLAAVSPASAATAGFLFGLAAVTKHQAWLFLPLLAGIAVLSGWHRRQWRRWWAGLVPVLLLLPLWDVARTGELVLWGAQIRNYGGIRPIWSWELQPRLLAWVDLWRIAAGSAAWGIGLLLSVSTLLVRSLGTQERAAAYDVLIILYLLAYFCLHWLLAVPVWDRYLLPVIPLAALLLARGLTLLSSIVTEKAGKRLAPSLSVLLLFLLAILLLLPAAVKARSGRFDIGGQPQAGQDVAQIARFLALASYGTVLYDHWYSWQWRYYLFDSRVFVSWFPHPAALVEDLTVFGGDGSVRYLALPATAVAQPVQRAIIEAGFQLKPISTNTRQIVLYQVIPPVSKTAP